MILPVLGGGGWGTALAVAAARGGQQVRLWGRRPDFTARLAEVRENREYLPGVLLPEQIEVTSDLATAVSAADLALAVVPSVGMPELLGALPRSLGIVLCAKGLAPQGQRLSEYAAGLGFERVAVLSGPNLAAEVGRGLPAATVVASHDAALARQVQSALMSSSLRVYTSADVVGVELGGVLKNVMALAAGMCDGLRLGDNAKATLLTRGLREMNRYLLALGAQEDTVYGLSGLGDLIATATSPHSRNRSAGEAIALGEDPRQGGKVIEGLRAAGLLDQWARAHGYDLPIVQAVAQVTRGEWTPQQGVAHLMSRDAKPEHH